VTDANFSVSVGTAIQRLVPPYDPAEIIGINPRFRGGKYLLLRDEIVLIELERHRILSVPRSGGVTTGRLEVQSTSAAFSSRLRSIA
jgi:hypothetical protein